MTRSEMEAQGFKYMGTCNCDGVTNYKYFKEGYTFYIRPKRQTFHIKKGVHYEKKNEPLINFNAIKENLFPTKVLEGTNTA